MNKALSNVLTMTEVEKLRDAERIIERGQQTFIEVGKALQRIRDGKLYRVSYATFEEYCETKWGWTRQHAYRFIEATETVKSLPAKCHQLVTNEATARAVAQVEPERRAEVVKQAAQSGPVTAASIREAAKPEVLDVDGTGLVIPQGILADWHRAVTFKDTLADLKRVKLAVARMLESEDVCGAEVTNTTLASLKACESDLDRVLPYAVCPTCQGRQRTSCRLCKGRGFISEFLWRSVVTDEAKQLRAKQAAKKGGAK
jgi:hypothetical protein